MKAPKRKSSLPLRLEWIEAGSLADNPDNWRRHPAGQMKALKAAMADVGWAGALLYNERTRRLIDGHARKKMAGARTVVPVLVGSWTPEQEKKILATLDPLAAMAQADGEALENLLKDVQLDDKAFDGVEAMLRELIDGDKPPREESPQRKEKRQAAARSRKLSDLFAVSVECKSERDQLAFYRRMQKEGRKCKLFVL
jgi:hypothetical protein